MLFLFITCFSFIFLFNYSLPLKPFPGWVSEMRLISFCFLKDLSSFLYPTQAATPSIKSIKNTVSASLELIIPSKMSSAKSKKTQTLTVMENVELSSAAAMSVLDLPELALECILERLPPDGLFRMSSVCSDLRQRCLSDHLWEKHMSHKWDRIIGPAAYRQWQWHISSRNDSSYSLESSRKGGVGRGLVAYLSRLWPFMLVRSNSHNLNYHCNDNHTKTMISLQPPVDSVVAFYRALETGKFWFPAQVFNRENGHVGFMLSCYDAELSYDSRTNTFQARYPPHGRRAVAIESGVTWDRLRAAAVDTCPHDLHVSDCLNDLRPKDHIEIQWRRNKEFPYGWWYGIVGHLETCDGNENYCRCHESDTVVLEFNQYTPGSRWRHTTINRKDHREEGNEADGFYGGIRKLYRNDEISMWKQFWPAEVLE